MTLLDLTDPASQALLFHRGGRTAPLSADAPPSTIDDSSSSVLARMNDIVRGVSQRPFGRATKAY